MKVLIKENSITFRIIFSNYFNRLNFEVVFLEEAHRILEILSEHSFDLYILSSTDEKETAFLVSKIQEQEHKTQTIHKPILFCANNLELERKLEYLNLGVTSFLKKPFSLKSLKHTLETIIPGFKTWEDVRILIAEDSEPTQKVLKIYLSKHKVKMTFASDGKEAMEILAAKSREFHLVITDINMPNMDGFELAKIIRYALDLPDIPIIFLSGEDEAQNSNEFLSLGNGWIQKPFSAEIVKQVLPYLEIAKKYKEHQEILNQNQVYTHFIQTLYHKFENSCSLDLGFSLELVQKISQNTSNEKEIFLILPKIILEAQLDFQSLHEFLLENANHFEFSNTIKLKQIYNEISNSLKTIIEYKKLQIEFKTEIGTAILKVNSVVFEFIFLEVLISFILSLKEKQKLFIRAYLDERFLCLEFFAHDVTIKNFPNWIFEKENLYFSIREESGSKIYLLKFEFDSNN